MSSFQRGMLGSDLSSEEITGEILATPQQIALLNNMLEQRFRFESSDLVTNSPQSKQVICFLSKDAEIKTIK